MDEYESPDDDQDHQEFIAGLDINNPSIKEISRCSSCKEVWTGTYDVPGEPYPRANCCGMN
jgi:hypothetical protein